MMRRMLARATADEDESAIDITPMLDVVFIMLIFFIVTATFVKEAGIDVNRPDAATAVKQDKANILIAINANNEIWIDRRRVDIRSVRPNIERLHAENPQGSVVIQADKESKTETLIKVMDASRSAGVFNVAIAAQEQ
jgi:biopolymer transport protein ExbD